MKVLICKFFDDKDVEHKIRRLASREKKRTGNSLRVFCIDEQVQKRLKCIGIKSEIFKDFLHWYEESSWERLFQLSDQLHASAENNNLLKYSSLNFLTLEYHPFPYVSAIKLSSLCERIAEEGCEVLILVLTPPYNQNMPDISSPNIKTVKYAPHKESHRLIRLIKRASIFIFALAYICNLIPRVRNNKSSSDPNAGLPSKLITEKSVLLVVGAPMYARAAVAISKECLRNGLIPCIATDSITSTAIFRHQAFKYTVRSNTKIRDLISFKLIDILGLLYRLKVHIDSLSTNIMSFSTQSNEFLFPYLCKEILLDYLLYLCIPATSIIRYLEKEITANAPDLIVLMPDGSFFQYIAAALAKKYRIPTLACSSALENDHPRAFVRHLHADKKAVMGEVIKKVYVDSGVEPHRIVVTGAANFDSLFDRDKEKDKQALLAHNIDLNKKVILFTTQYMAFSETERMLTGVINAVLKLKDFRLVVKVHPRDDLRNYQNITEEYFKSGVRIVKDVDLYALINNCELLITKYSTTALEAIMFDKPVITINFSGEPTSVPYAEDGAAIGVCRNEDLEQAILKALYDDETRDKLRAGRDKFVRYWAGEPDGKAAQRIVTLMKGMIAASAKHSKGAA
jgi:glycosyltransferase involved in cell wall biosynthesis